MAQPIVEGLNRFIYFKRSTAWVRVGCANSISINETTNMTEYMCDADGNTKNYFPGSRDAKISLGGTSLTYETGEAATNWSVDDFRAIRRAGSLVEFIIAEASTTGTKALKGKGYISSITEDSKNSDPTTYKIDLQCVEDDLVTETLA